MRSPSALIPSFAARVLIGSLLAACALAACALTGCAAVTGGGAQESPAGPGSPAEGDEPAAGGPSPDEAAIPEAQPEGGPPPHAPGEPSPPSQPSRSPEPGGLLQGGQASTFQLPVPPGEPARALRVVVDAIDNPQSHNLVLVVTALMPAAPIELGRLSFFPTSSGGTFLVPLPATVAAHTDATGTLTLRCSLEVEGGSEPERVQAQVRSLALVPPP